MKTKVFAFILAAIISIAAVFTGCNGAKKTAAVEENGVKAAMEADTMAFIMNSIDVDSILGTGDDFFTFFKNAEEAKGMSVTADFWDDEVEFDLTIAGLSDGSKIRSDVSIDGEGNPYGEPLGLSIYGDKDILSVDCGVFLGENALAIKLEGFEEVVTRFAESSLGKMFEIPSAQELLAVMAESGLTEEAFNEVMDAVEALNSDEAENQMIEAVFAIYEDCFGEIGENTVTCNDGHQHQAYTLKATLDNEDLYKLVDVFVEYYESVTLSGAAFMETLTGANEYADEMGNQFSELGALIKNELSVFDIKLNETLYFDKETGKYIKSDLEGSITKDEQVVTITGNEYILDNGAVADFELKAGDQILNADISLISQSTAAEYSLVLNATLSADIEAGEIMGFEATFGVDKNDDTYAVYVTAFDGSESEEIFRIEGDIEYSDKSLELSIDRVAADGEEEFLPENKIAFNLIEDVSGHENVKYLFDLTEEEIHNLIMNIAMVTGQY